MVPPSARHRCRMMRNMIVTVQRLVQRRKQRKLLGLRREKVSKVGCIRLSLLSLLFVFSFSIIISISISFSLLAFTAAAAA